MQKQYFIGLSLPTKENQVLEQIKTILSPNMKSGSPPHITLIPPFRFYNETDLVKRIELLAKNYHSFQVKLKSAGCFRQPKYGTVFLSPEDEEPILDLFISLKKLLPEINCRNDFVAHLTLANRVAFEDIDNLVETVKNLGLQVNFKVKSFTLFGRSEHEPWKVLKTVPFGNPKHSVWDKRNQQVSFG